MAIRDEYLHFRATNASRSHAIDGRSWQVLERPGDGPALLLLHGALGNEWIFFRLFNHLPPATRIVALRMPLVADGQLLAEDIVQIIQTLALKKPVILGAGTGGHVAQFTASIRTDLAGLILSTPMVEPRPPARPEPALLALLGPVGDRIFRALARRALSRWPQTLPVQAELSDFLLSEFLTDRPTRRLASRPRMPTGHQHTPRLSPERVLLIQTEDDPLIGREARAMTARAFPHARRLELAWGGHFPYLTRPQDFAAAVTQFAHRCWNESNDGDHDISPSTAMANGRGLPVER